MVLDISTKLPTEVLRIDVAIKPASRLRAFLFISLTLVMLLLAGLSKLLVWQYLVLIIITAVVIIYLSLSRPILLHISQPPLSHRVDRGWQLLMRTGRADELWQVNLEAAKHYNKAIHFNFTITEPYHRALAITLFKDQVDAEQWRQLSILANSTE